MLNFVGKWCCNQGLDWPAEAACRAEASFQVNQPIVTQFYL